ncbi:TrkH family potassium uptake protein [Streptococcus moroccensis]|uniref:Trk system potassium uptake protein TrkH n=1 Tax=Streptococcus moroccensis TaxID=1451356 RepID=A0ABT9YR59_9STRE|nr:TrkH family potassium uptake protein [Streptococcus moroccensis]MDQ0222479.1 trk system potassium uptake protein TrkH [Streptococcus moroccensis]
MKHSLIRYFIGKLLQVEAVLLSLPLVVSFIYQESTRQKLAYATVILGLVVLGSFLSFKKPPQLRLNAREGIFTVALSWICLSMFGALPLVFSGEIPNFFNAFFEIASGFTTTGSSVLSDLSILAKSSLFWRSFTHLIGGMGILVFTLAILPNSGSDTVQLMRAEVPGPVFGKIVSKLSQTARILYTIYISLTAILVLVLCLAGVPLFDSLLLSFGTAGTGGFGVSNAGFSIYPHPQLVEWIIGFGMLLFGVNFNLYYYMLIGYGLSAFKDEEFKTYLAIVGAATLAVTVGIAGFYSSNSDALRTAFFNVASIMTTTGFATADFNQWHLITQMILILLMFIGGSAGSTAGGLKVTRIIIYAKMALAELRRVGQPRRVVSLRFNQKVIEKSTQVNLSHYLLIYIVVFILILFSVALESKDFTTAFTAVATTFNNIGPGLGEVGPMANFSSYSNWNKLVLTFSMLAGRLEIYPILILFAPATIKGLFKQKN